jgi:putative ABC transport system ATP-binding protein
MEFIQFEHISKFYGQGSSTTQAIDDITFSIEEGEFIAIMGESGAGKSTLLSIIGAMNRPSGGIYTVDDIDVYQLSLEKQADFRREYLGFVFQSFHLVPYLTVIENVLLPLVTVRKIRKEKEALAMDALDWVGLKAKARRLPNQISGGEKERVAVARAIVNNPAILLADEPTGNLDSRNSQEIMALLGRLHAGGTTVIMVTHSATCAAHAQRVIEIKDGCLHADNRPRPIQSADHIAA